MVCRFSCTLIAWGRSLGFEAYFCKVCCFQQLLGLWYFHVIWTHKDFKQCGHWRNITGFWCLFTQSECMETTLGLSSNLDSFVFSRSCIRFIKLDELAEFNSGQLSMTNGYWRLFCVSHSQLIEHLNRKVLLRECMRHITCSISSTPSAVLSWGCPNSGQGVPHLWTGGTSPLNGEVPHPWRGWYPTSEVSRIWTWPGYSLSGPGQGVPQPWPEYPQPPSGPPRCEQTENIAFPILRMRAVNI